MQSIEQSFQVNFNYKVYFTENLFFLDNTTFINGLNLGSNDVIKKLLIFIDNQIIASNPNLIPLVETYFSKNSHKINLVAAPIAITGGEQVKNDAHYVEDILNAINKYGIDRHSYTLAIGGGAVLDMVGYASAIAHRGIRHIRVPSTVLSQNDSGVGVKNSINYFHKKNFLGTFVPPFAVFNDFTLLKTLSTRDWRAGIAEAVKVALIKDAAFFFNIVEQATSLMNRDKKAMQYLIFRCAELHLQHIASGDPFEMGSSRPLDFGHWAAHKMEHMSNFEIRHGEAVAAGIALDATYSYLKEMILKEEWTQIISLLKTLGFKIFYAEMKTKENNLNNYPDIFSGLIEFREHLGGQLTIMLLSAIGKGVEVHEMDFNLIAQSIDLLEKNQ